MIIPVLLAGGSGSRLWPLSRQAYPKQFVPLTTDRSPFQEAVARLSGPGYGRPLVLTGEALRFVATHQLGAIGCLPEAVFIEPEGRGTAAAVLLAALALGDRHPEALMLVAPADHTLPDAAAFRATVEAARSAAEAGQIVTFGITPTRADSGYGYLALSDAADPTGHGLQPLKGFVEKPDPARAEQMLAEGGYLWNAGLFLARADVMLAAFATHAPEMIDLARAAYDGRTRDLGFLRLAPGPWGGLPDTSIDYAVMEKAANLSVIRYDGHWSDLGDWEALWRETPGDADGVARSGPVTAIDCTDTLLRSEAEGVELVGLGLDGIMAVATGDAVLVADRSRAQQVRRVVDTLKEAGARQATAFARDNRPWGWFEGLAHGPRFQVKRLVVDPGCALSLQSHVHRAEHWIIVEGTARVTIDGVESLVGENQSVYIPLGAVHRLENPGKLPMVLIEVQTGSYLGEDDIIRYEDVYARD